MREARADRVFQRVPKRFAMVLVCVTLTGAGCWKASPPQKPQSTKPISAAGTPSQNPPVIRFQTGETPNQAVNEELNGILKKFRELKSFRIKFTLPSPQGTVAAELSFLRPNRFRGTMRLAAQSPIDIIVVDDSLYMRAQGSAWLDLSGTETSKALGNSLRNALNGDTSLEKIGVDSSVLVKKSVDQTRRCDLYKSVVRSPDGAAASLEICAMNGLPKYVTIITQKGPFHFEYEDYNALFLIEKPL